MRKSKVFSAVVLAVATILATSTTAAAQDYRPHYRVETPRGNPHYGRVPPYEARREMERQRRHYELRRYGRPQGYYGSRPYYDRYGQYRSGGMYRGPRYEVRDYRHYDLPPPRAGYRYYRDRDDNIIMVAVATGIIAAIIANH